jgi:hypothetical protein
MKNKEAKKMRGLTVQKFDLVPITDPAELEAFDRRRKAAEAAMAAAERIAGIGSLMMNLSPKAIHCVIAALDHYQQNQDEQLHQNGLPKDDVPDLINDQRYVAAIKKELQECHENFLRTREADHREHGSDE